MNDVVAGIQPGMQKYCSGCAKVLHKDARVCPGCGAPQMATYAPAASPYPRSPKNKGVAIVLALLLGGFGIHKFYLNQVGLGILYLVFCWTFVPAIIAIVEAIVYAVMDEDVFHEKYG